MQELKKLMSEYEALRNDIIARGKDLFKTGFEEFLKENPEVIAIKWDQYAPYFNDGEACTFSVHEPQFKLTTTPEDAGDYGDGFEYLYSMKWDAAKKAGVDTKDFHDPLLDKLDAIDDLLQSSAMEDILEEVYGDGVTVTVTREGVDIDECSHD